MKSLTLACLVPAITFPAFASALAQTPADEDASREDAATEGADGDRTGETLADRIKAVERKVFLKRRRFEIHPYVGMDLNDAFFQHFFVGGTVAYHFEDSFALELRGGGVFAEIEKDSVRFVRVETGSLLEGPLSLVAHGEVDLEWAPIYGKIALFGDAILHFDTFFAAGGGIFVTQRDRRDSAGLLEEVTNVNPAINVGIGQRYFINEWIVLKVELRNYSFIETSNESDLQNVTVLGLALSGFFPTSFSYEFQ